MQKDPRFHMQFTPAYSAWTNQVERLIAEVTRSLVQPSDHRWVQPLEKGLGDWGRAWNHDLKLCIWAKVAGDILDSLGEIPEASQRRRTLGASGPRIVAQTVGFSPTVV